MVHPEFWHFFVSLVGPAHQGLKNSSVAASWLAQEIAEALPLTVCGAAAVGGVGALGLQRRARDMYLVSEVG
jgi:hypothetical protein